MTGVHVLADCKDKVGAQGFSALIHWFMKFPCSFL